MPEVCCTAIAPTSTCTSRTRDPPTNYRLPLPGKRGGQPDPGGRRSRRGRHRQYEGRIIILNCSSEKSVLTKQQPWTHFLLLRSGGRGRDPDQVLRNLAAVQLPLQDGLHGCRLRVRQALLLLAAVAVTVVAHDGLKFQNITLSSLPEGSTLA